MKSQNKSAFTMIELIVYMGIIVAVLFLDLALTKLIKVGNPAENILREAVEDSWNEMNIKSQIYHTGYRIDFNRDRMVFMPGDRRIKRKIINYPGTLKLKQHVQFSVADDGFESPRTIHWYTTDGQEKYQQRIQLGWSGYRLRTIY
ncbi:hypothetical protein KTE19_00405 [Lentilactobacillus sp. IMAU92037]|uniref:hypothetical protein n=1 Tax=Lentilactobacillus dabitei TaxID=2831523 RepID=UPI001C2CA663|nr:hypothetical protein [Lentilactobacillus dabitei]MBV0929191.1 hypothetical protein [Lentilactobacillus dabitei]